MAHEPVKKGHYFLPQSMEAESFLLYKLMFIKIYALLSFSKTYSQVGLYKMFLMGFDLTIAPPHLQEYVFSKQSHPWLTMNNDFSMLWCKNGIVYIIPILQIIFQEQRHLYDLQKKWN